MQNNEHDQNDFCRSKSLKDWTFLMWIISKDFKKVGYKHPNCSFIKEKSDQHHIMLSSRLRRKDWGREGSPWEKFQWPAGTHSRLKWVQEAVTGEEMEAESGHLSAESWLWKEGCHSVFLGNEEEAAQEESKKLSRQEGMGRSFWVTNELFKLFLLVWGPLKTHCLHVAPETTPPREKVAQVKTERSV